MLKLGAGVCEALRDVGLVLAVSDPLLESVDLIDKCSAACVDGTVPVRVHSLGRYRAAVTKKGAPTRGGQGEWAPDQRGYANTHPTNDGPRSDAPTTVLMRGNPPWARQHQLYMPHLQRP